MGEGVFFSTGYWKAKSPFSENKMEHNAGLLKNGKSYHTELKPPDDTRAGTLAMSKDPIKRQQFKRVSNI